MKVPDLWTMILLGLASYRIYRLISMDTILDTTRAKLLRLGDWREGQPVPASYRSGIGDFLTCPWCLGFWLALGWWGAWQFWPHATLVVAAPFVISALVGLVAKLDKED